MKVVLNAVSLGGQRGRNLPRPEDLGATTPYEFEVTVELLDDGSWLFCAPSGDFAVSGLPEAMAFLWDNDLEDDEDEDDDSPCHVCADSEVSRLINMIDERFALRGSYSLNLPVGSIVIAPKSWASIKDRSTEC
jgi:hypothetical protein